MPARSSDRGNHTLASQPGGSTSNSGEQDPMPSGDIASQLLQAIDALRGEIKGLKQEIRDCCVRADGDVPPPPSDRGCSDEKMLIEIQRLRCDIREWRERDERERQIWELRLL